MDADLTVCRGCGERFWSALWAYCVHCRAATLCEQVNELESPNPNWESLLLAGETVEFDDLCEEE